jgi:phosphohistidine phosphatase
VRVYIVRHAEAAPGEPDEERRLSAEGHEQARALARRLAADGVRPDALLTSPLVRAQQTAAALGEVLGVEPEADERLRPGASAERLRAAVHGRGEIVVTVGHQPDCGLIAAELTAAEPPKFAPGGVLALDLD